MENNIFFKNKKDKFNPDVISGLTKKNSERKKNDFKESKVLYNGITNVVPAKITNGKDLKLKVDQPVENTKRVLSDKLSERNKQENELKPVKLKTLPKDLIVDKHIDNFEELKKNSETFIKKEEDIKKQQKIKKQELIEQLTKNKKIFNEIKDLVKKN
jgi:hypothetical protein